MMEELIRLLCTVGGFVLGVLFMLAFRPAKRRGSAPAQPARAPEGGPAPNPPPARGRRP